MIKSKELQ